MEYPKIETLFKRDDKFIVVPDDDHIRCREFLIPSEWLVTQKIDGMNVRVHYDDYADRQVTFYGRGENTQFSPKLLYYLETYFTPALFQNTFRGKDGTMPADVWLYGEGYGAGVQKGGNYRLDPSFRLFDVLIDSWWMNWSSIEDIARKLNIKTVPVLNYGWPTLGVVASVQVGQQSKIDEGGNADYLMEGVVCRTEPLLFMRNGERLMWKLKTKDFKGGKR